MNRKSLTSELLLSLMPTIVSRSAGPALERVPYWEPKIVSNARYCSASSHKKDDLEIAEIAKAVRCGHQRCFAGRCLRRAQAMRDSEQNRGISVALKWGRRGNTFYFLSAYPLLHLAVPLPDLIDRWIDNEFEQK